MSGDNAANFRNQLGTQKTGGGRAWVYADKPSGNLHTKRLITSVVLLVVFFLFPFVKVSGEPFLLFNFLERKFIVFGQIFWPQDFHLFVIAMITGIVAIILFTVIYGRVWCGWVCPQTVFMEMVFRKIEFWIEGNAASQKKLREGPFTFEKLWKRISKQALFILIALLISHTTLAYLIGFDQLKTMVAAGPAASSNAFIALLVFTVLIYGVFSWFREQACILVCPYGRLQSVLLDTNSLVVSYDYVRGEPKGAYKKSEDRKTEGKGDCIACNRCVKVCPTGIDIRNGVQLECINCTACIDACNKTMRGVGFPQGLIRITSENAIKEGRPFKVTGRIRAYSIVLFLLIGSLILTFSLRNNFESTILRAPGTLFQKSDNGRISNMYTFKTINKSREDMEIGFKLLSPKGELVIIGNNTTLPRGGDLAGVFLVKIDADNLNSSSTEVEIGVYSNGELIKTKKSTFIGP